MNHDAHYFVGIIFNKGARAYFFSCNDNSFIVGDKVIVETARGIELGEVSIAPIDIAKFNKALELKPILRRATENDVKLATNNENDAVDAHKVCEQEIKRLGLDMRLISSEYTLDKAKVIFTYVADERVDFRELLKALAARLHTRIELRQINSRDKAKLVGGIGMCGRPLCCSNFLADFESISINRAKNQMLAINIPKLSGHCGKLMCCLKYEDDCYSELKAKYPDVGFTTKIDNKQFKVTSINVISGQIRLENEEDTLVLSYDDFVKQTNYHPRQHFNKNNNRHEEK